MKMHRFTSLVVMVAAFVALTGSVAANPANINTSDKISIDVCGDGLVHAVIEKSSLAAQSTHKNIVFSSRKAIMNEVSAAVLSPVLNNKGIVRAEAITSVNGITYLGSNTAAIATPQP